MAQCLPTKNMSCDRWVAGDRRARAILAVFVMSTTVRAPRRWVARVKSWPLRICRASPLKRA